MKPMHRSHRPQSGMTLVELMIAVTILGLVLIVTMGILLSSNRLQARTARRAIVQMNCRQGLSLMTTELMQAGADPADPPIGLVAVVSADSHLVRVRSDLNGDGAIQTTEPSEDVTYRYNGTTRELLRDPGTGAEMLVPDVKTLKFSYFDGANQLIGPLPLSSANAARVRTVGVTLTAEDRDSRPITLTTRISLRNS